MLIALQKKLSELTCPSCQAKHSLQVMLSCDITGRECEPICRCRDCGVSLIIEVPSGFSPRLHASQLVLRADLLNATCYVEVIEPEKEQEWFAKRAA
jgi:transcription elongation factor Elf1